MLSYAPTVKTLRLMIRGLSPALQVVDRVGWCAAPEDRGGDLGFRRGQGFRSGSFSSGETWTEVGATLITGVAPWTAGVSWMPSFSTNSSRRSSKRSRSARRSRAWH